MLKQTWTTNKDFFVLIETPAVSSGVVPPLLSVVVTNQGEPLTDVPGKDVLFVRRQST